MTVPQSTSNTSNKSILLIDNQHSFIDALSSVLQDWGYKVSSHDDPVEALQSLKANSYFLVICELHMPGFSGYKLLYRFLKEKPKQVCCLMTSSENNDPLLIKTIRLNNVKGLIKKPISFDKLSTLLEQMLIEVQTIGTN